MAKQSQDKSFYAISKQQTGDNDGSTTGGIWSTDAVGLDVAKIQLTGADENDTVKCNLSVLVTVNGTMAGNLQKGDAFITLSGIDGLDGAESVDLSQEPFTYLGSTNDEKTGTATFNLNSGKISFSKGNLEKTLKADVWLVNKSSDAGVVQDYLAGKNLNVSIKTTVSDCETTSTAGE